MYALAVSDVAELFTRWRDGDADAGDELLRACFEPLRRFFANKVDAGVDDLIQKTLLHCVESKETVRDAEHFRTFLFSVARNRLFDRLRKQLRLGEHVNLSDVSLHELRTSPSSAAARDERRQIVAEALRRIPLDYQIALELTYWEGMKAPQIAAVLDLNANTVRTRITRARAALAKELERVGAADLGETEPLPS